MLSAIKQFFETQMDSGSALDEEHRLRLASAALLVEMMHQDHEVDEKEEAAVLDALQQKFDLPAPEAQSLLKLAHEETKGATDYHQFTHLIAKHYPQDKKIKLIEFLWSVAYADGVLDKYEEHMVRRIADLIHVSHKDFMQAKHKFEK